MAGRRHPLLDRGACGIQARIRVENPTRVVRGKVNSPMFDK